MTESGNAGDGRVVYDNGDAVCAFGVHKNIFCESQCALYVSGIVGCVQDHDVVYMVGACHSVKNMTVFKFFCR